MRLVITGAIALLLAGCASILSESQYPVTFNTTPSGATLSITNRDGNVVFEGTSPTTLTLKSGAGFFKGEEYTVSAALNGQVGTATLTPGIDGWYVGNILFGGLIGILIVDPATGAMYRLPETFNVALGESVAATDGEPALQILDIADVPEAWQPNLIAVQ